jgi:hypothetical protein
MTMTQQKLIEMLEPLVDATSLGDVILALARTCNEKAEHLRMHWQDERSAKVWDTLADKLDRIGGDSMI